MDQHVLDAAFAEMLDAAEEGRAFVAEKALSEHPHLQPLLDDLLELAGEVAVGPRVAERLPASEDLEVISRLGRGGMGSVYLAKQRRLGRVVALKVLPGWLASRSSKERFQREALATARLRHPNIITIHDLVELNGEFAYTMEYIAGGTLRRLIDEATDAPEGERAAIIEGLLQAPRGAILKEYPRQIATWGAAIADAVHAMHGAGLIHRDIKPSNILIRPDGTALLSDFGLVYQVDQNTLTMPGAFAGSIAYAAPEQLRAGTHGLTARADVYSLGATLFHALTGRVPYSGQSAVQVLAAIDARSELRGALCRVPPDLGVIVRKAMAPDPSQRYATAAELAEDLRRFLCDRPVTARPTSVRYRLRKFLRRHRSACVAAVIAGVLGVCLVAALSVKLFLFPVWSEQALTRARLLPHQRSAPDQQMRGLEPHSGLQSAIFWGLVYPGGADEAVRDDFEAAQRERFPHAIREYRRAALFMDPTGKADVEREVLEFVLGELGPASDGPLVPTSRSPAFEMCRRLEDARTRWSAALRAPAPRTQAPQLPVDELSALRPDELRQLGLACYFRSMPDAALDAWAELERRGEDDAFIAGMLGMLYLMNDQAELAYPRLRTAMVAYPQSPHFTMFTADAAAQVGDRVKARQYLAAAKATGLYDRKASLRIECLIQLGEGDVDGVMRSVRESRCALDTTWSPVLFTQVARRLASLRDQQPARAEELDPLIIECAVIAGSNSPPALRAVELFKQYGLPWWNALPDDQRLRLARLHVQPATLPNGFGCDWEHLFIAAIVSCSSAGQLTDSSLSDIARRSAALDDGMRRGQVGGDIARNHANSLEAYARRAALSPRRVDELARWLLTGEGVGPADADLGPLPDTVRPAAVR